MQARIPDDQPIEGLRREENREDKEAQFEVSENHIGEPDHEDFDYDSENGPGYVRKYSKNKNEIFANNLQNHELKAEDVPDNEEKEGIPNEQYIQAIIGEEKAENLEPLRNAELTLKKYKIFLLEIKVRIEEMQKKYNDTYKLRITPTHGANLQLLVDNIRELTKRVASKEIEEIKHNIKYILSLAYDAFEDEINKIKKKNQLHDSFLPAYYLNRISNNDNMNVRILGTNFPTYYLNQISNNGDHYVRMLGILVKDSIKYEREMSGNSSMREEDLRDLHALNELNAIHSPYEFSSMQIDENKIKEFDYHLTKEMIFAEDFQNKMK